MTSVLIAEDTTRPVSPLERDLRANGYTTTSARDDNQVLALASDARVDLVILDLEPSDIRGPFTLQALRAAGATMPVIVLDPSGRASAALMLESGADDFMAKPYRFEELLARMSARLRPTLPPAHETLTIGDLSLDPLTRRCTIEDRVVELTTREFDLAEALLRHPNQVLTRDQLLTQIWGPGLDAGSNVIDVYVGYLRRKLGADIIHTVRGMGYRLAS